MTRPTVLVVGGGIAGASVAAELAPFAKVTLIEAERIAGYHATGRSAAFWHESYGGPDIQPLSRASYATLAAPDPAFSERGFLTHRDAVTIARREEAAELAAFAERFAGRDMAMEAVDRAGLENILPGLRDDWGSGIREPDCSDIDVAGLHQAYLKAAARGGAVIRLDTRLTAAQRTSDGHWAVETTSGSLGADVIVNAAGAWADNAATACSVGSLPVQPMRRTVVQLRLGIPTPATLPLVIHVAGEFYIKGEGEGRIWLSPHDETPVEPHDVAPEELDVAIAIDRFQQLVDWPIAAVERKWAGLRSFAPDRLPVIGYDPLAPGFAWLAGQGGIGIMTSPALAKMAASEIMRPFGVNLETPVSADRYRADRLT